MTDATRLRQVCLVAPHLEPVVGDIAAIMGLTVCYRDPNVARYGLENALLPVDSILLEVVAPFQGGTAAGRFIDKTGGRGGYMAILSCADPRERQNNAEVIGVRTSHVIDRAPYLGIQLHPRDCRAAFIEFNHTANSDNIRGPYPPAGPDWHTAIRDDVTMALTEVTLTSPDPRGLADHWGRIIGIPASGSGIDLVNCSIKVVEGESEIMSGLTFRVRDPAAVLRAAQVRGHAVTGESFRLGGVDFHITA
ncbi:MAG: hypothetical protein G4V63_08930 [Candidatus Afipia apatlaquensis]|uniref:Glyoxalase-like domain-containing protein n=1 Tax=Candidatus Afipia apatlaquensis TaxID=2712852 RepID=A0A7C9VLR2_9BRAD|nr:hypothetical protein [Candidatus Afipia apatlaquensis]